MRLSWMYPTLTRRGLQCIVLCMRGTPGGALQVETLVALDRPLSNRLHKGWATGIQMEVQEIYMQLQ